AWRWWQGVGGRQMEQGVDLGHCQPALTLEHRRLMVEGGELEVGLQRIGLPHTPGGILGEGGATELPHQPNRLVNGCLIARDAEIVEKGRARVAKQVEAYRLHVVGGRFALRARSPTAQTPFAEERQSLSETDAVGGIDDVATET